MNKPTFKPYRAKDGWRWRLVARNGRIIADSGEAYTRKRDALRAIDTVLIAIFDGHIEGGADAPRSKATHA